MGEMVKNFPREGSEGAPGGARSVPITRGESSGESPLGEAPGRGVAEEAREVAAGVAEQAKDLVSTQVTRTAGRSAHDLGDVARALHETKRQLGDNIAAPYVERAANQLERLSDFLRTADAREMVFRVESFARREPLLFLGGAFALGILGARFVKSSAHHREGGLSRERSFTDRYRGRGGEYGDEHLHYRGQSREDDERGVQYRGQSESPAYEGPVEQGSRQYERPGAEAGGGATQYEGQGMQAGQRPRQYEGEWPEGRGKQS